MRFLGNKTKLLPAIEELAREKRILQPARELRRTSGGGEAAPGACPVVLDVFCGTASVSRRFRELGAIVIANDRMRLGHVLATAAVSPPRSRKRALDLLARCAAAEDRDGLITRLYSPAGAAGRGYFTPEAARRIDAALETIAAARLSREADEATAAWLTAAVLEGADRVANGSGTYGAFLKTWQPNALRPFRLEPPESSAGPRGLAFQEDANVLVGRHACDLLYVDPPYNAREYHANYHVPEAIAARPFLSAEEVRAFEASTYGKTGLRPYERSAYCDARRVEGAFRDLIAGSQAKAVIVSYSEEGLLTQGEIERALAEGLGTRKVECYEVPYKRYRSDRDGAARMYRQVPGRARDGLMEWLFFAARGESGRSETRARVRASRHAAPAGRCSAERGSAPLARSS